MSPARKEIDMSTYRGRWANRVRNLRLELGYTAAEVVERMEKFGYPVTLTSYYKWETNQREPDWDAMPALAKSLKVKIVDLFPKK